MTIAQRAKCIHFGVCGGCATQDVPYPDQLRLKQAALEALFAPFWQNRIPVAPSPAVWHYRNRVDFNFAPKRYDEPPPAGFARETVLGFTRKGRWYWPFDAEECLIAPEGAAELLESVREWYRAEGLRAYDSRLDEGFLRVLMLRECKRTGERLAGLFTSAGSFDEQRFIDAVHRVYPGAAIYHGESARKSRGAFDDVRLRWLAGPSAIDEELHVPDRDTALRLRFRISPVSFFQTNSLAAEVLYGKIRQWVGSVSPRILYDLYGGSGGIALSCADLVEVVRSVESAPAATADGESNAAGNGIENVYFTTEVMKTYLQRIAESGGMEPGSAAVVDPPRSGMTPKPVRRLIASRPEHILYVSCKPEALAQELPAFLEVYDLVSLEAVDMFPHTPHVEALAALRLR